MSFNFFLRRELLTLTLILILAGLLRTYKIGNPLADWHSWRQADTASVTREYVKHGIDLMRPTFQDLSNIPSGKDNPEGYRMVEFPFINAGLAVVLRAYPNWDLVVVSRLASIIFSLGTIAALYYLVRALSGVKVALLTALIYAVLPYSVYYSRVILPEPFMLFFLLFSLATFYVWLEKSSWFWYGMSLISLILALLLKPFVAFVLPTYVAILIYKHGLAGLKKWPVYVYLAVAFVPMLAWRHWITNYPEGIPAFEWLFNSNGIRLRPAWFRWLFYERLTKLWLGYVGMIFFGAGSLALASDVFTWLKKVITKPTALFSNPIMELLQTDNVVYAAWSVGILIYLIVIATGNVQHDYYQILLIPIVTIILAKGMVWLFEHRPHSVSKKMMTVGLLLAAIISLYQSWQQVRGYFNINHWEYVHAGRVADQVLPDDAKVIAPAMGDTQFLFQTNRTGWPMSFDINHKISLGATHFLNTSFDGETKELESKYQTVIKTPEFILLDLRLPLPATSSTSETL